VLADDALTGPPIGTIQELLERMAAIAQVLPATDGLACFNRMYQLVTGAVQQHLTVGVFGDPAWVDRLDVVFGNLFLDAVRASVDNPAQDPRAWAALLERRSDNRVLPLQFALAGMNAHINRDLSVALTLTCTALNTSLDAGSHHADYEYVNTILALVEPPIRQSFSDSFLLGVNQVIPGLQDVVANFDMLKARAGAWANAETLWALQQSSPALGAAFLDSLDHLVGFAGRGLLVPLLPQAHGSGT
jgi:hypothetical protein